MKNFSTKTLSTETVLRCAQVLSVSNEVNIVGNKEYIPVVRPIHSISSSILFI